MKCNIDYCSIYRTQKILKHKWIPIIIYVLAHEELKFNQIINQIEYISNVQATNALKILLTKEIIKNEDNKYKLTNKGIKLYEIVMLMRNFDKII